MSNNINKPGKRTFWKIDADGKLLRGMNEPNQVTSARYTITASDNAGDVYDPLPSVGALLSEGEIYSYQGGMVQVRQNHQRTNFEPSETPALFTVYRKNTENTAWVAGEEVIIGDSRTHNGFTWIAIQSHVTSIGSQPFEGSALWRKIEEGESGIEVWSQPTGGDGMYPTIDSSTGENYLVTHNGSTWQNIHTGGLNVWEPGVFGWEEVIN